MVWNRIHGFLSILLCLFIVATLTSCEGIQTESIETVNYFSDPNPRGLEEPITQDMIPVVERQIIFEALQDDIPAVVDDYNLSGLEYLTEKVQDGQVIVTCCADTTESNLWDLAVLMEADERIHYAEPNTIMEAQGFQLPNDPFLSEQTYLEDIRAIECWEKLYEIGVEAGGSEDVIVAVLDSGINYEHPDLKDKFTEGERGYCVVDSSGDTIDTNGHGTNAVGIIGMIANNNINGAGVAHNVKVLPIKTSDALTYATSNIVKAINYAVENDADIINMSFGTYYESSLMRETLEKASESCILIAAAGNDGVPSKGGEGKDDDKAANFYPAAYPFVIGVTSIDSSGATLSWSNYNSTGDSAYNIAAPGEDIYTTDKGIRCVYGSGTSVSTPIVSAAAALLRSYFPDREEYPPKLLTQWICQRTDNGKLDLMKLIFDESDKVSSVPETSFYIESVTFDNGIISAQITGGDAPYQYSFAILRDGVRYFESPFSTENYIEYTPKQTGSYTIHVIAADSNGLRTSAVFPLDTTDQKGNEHP